MTLYAGDAPGNAPYGYGANPRLQMLAKNAYKPTAAGDTAWQDWSNWNQQQANQNMASSGIQSGVGRNTNPSPQRSSMFLGQGGSPQFNFSRVQSSITPAPIYSPQMTQGAVNNAVAEQHRLGDFDYLQKMTDAPGRSRDAGTMYAAMRPMAQTDVAARRARAEIPLQDMFANTGNMMRGQLAQDREALGWGNLASRLFGNQIDYNQASRGLDDSRLQMLLSLLED